MVGFSRIILLFCFVPVLAGCEPTVRIEAPKEPITINLNVKIDADLRVKIVDQAEEDIENSPGIF